MEETARGRGARQVHSGDGGKYVVNMQNVISEIQHKTFDDIVKGKFGMKGARICKVSLHSVYVYACHRQPVTAALPVLPSAVRPSRCSSRRNSSNRSSSAT